MIDPDRGSAAGRSSASRCRVAIVGGGFAGLCAAQALGGGHSVSLFDPRADFEFLPNIHELISGHTRPQHLRLSHAGWCSRHGIEFVQERVTALDLAAARLTTDSGREHGWDVCVVAVGAVNQTGGVAGAEKHAMPFKSIADCEAIGRRLEHLLSLGRRLGLVVVGGGLEGVEALGELLRRLRGRKAWQVDLVDARTRLLEEAPAVLDDVIRQHCAKMPVRFHLRTRVRQVHDGSVEFNDGTQLPSDLTLWTGGGKAPDLLLASGLSREPGKWAKVMATLQTPDRSNVFVVGDAAELPDPVTKQAYHAMDMGRAAARNIEALARGRPATLFAAAAKPMVVSFGDLDTWVVVGRRVLSGVSLSVLKEGILDTTLARLDPPRDPRSLLGFLRRASGGIGGLMRTVLDSPSSLRRLAGVRVL
jgi:NADH dehydrogenase FAD-containing subunit